MEGNTVITLRMSNDLHNTCKAIAQKEEIPTTFVIRRLIKAGLVAEGKHLPSQVKTTTIPEWE